MPRKLSYPGYIKQLCLLLIAFITAILIYTPSTETADLTPSPELTNASVYPASMEAGMTGFKPLVAETGEHDNNVVFAGNQSRTPPTEGPGGPILVISTASNPFSRYTVEILRAEGLNEFAASDISAVTAQVLNNYDVVILGEMAVTAPQVALLTKWVNAGGVLIAFKPSDLLSPLFGISGARGTLSDKYLLVNTVSGPGVGIVNETIQFHGTANLHTLKGATSLATLYSSAVAATTNPAVTMKKAGNRGGSAIAFTYDLAKSIVYTRQGNPEWAGQKRDGEIDPIRSDDLFFPDWIDFNKIAIPQADEQQRLLANIILQGNLHHKPLPRFWYLPRDLKSVIVMTGDNHSDKGTARRFSQYYTLGPNTPQDVADWRAVRATSYIYPDRPIDKVKGAYYQEQGFEIALHTNTGLYNYTPASLQNDFAEQLDRFAISYPDFSAPLTNRSHCLNWSDWSSTPKVELQNGIRLDATYYYWPEAWMQNRPGMFTGSGMPMRFADIDGSLIDVYQVPTQITDETNMNYAAFCNALLDKAIGQEGYYGIFCANMHTDDTFSPGADAIVASAQARQVPVISARQLLDWLDGRNNSSFGDMAWRNNRLSFSITAQRGANNLKTMLPLYSEKGLLRSITRNGNDVPFTKQTIKGMQYAFFAPATGTHMYVADYTAKKNENHEDLLALLQDQPVQPGKAKKELTSAGKFYINVMPNPGISYFNLVISSNNTEPVSVRVLDISGRVVETHEKIASTGILRFGQSLRQGNYFAEVIQGDQRKVIKIIKRD